MPTKNSVSKGIQTQINEVEEPNNPKPVKKNFDEIIEQFQRALQCSNDNKMQNVPSNNVPTSDEAVGNKSYHVDTATQDNIVQGEKFTESPVVSSNADDGAVLCSVESNYTNNKKDENETTYEEIDLPIQEQMDVDVSANAATFTNFKDSSDEETTPKKSKQFTFTDSDLPDSDEIREILMLCPKPPQFEESYSDNSDMSEGFEILSNLKSCSEDESEQPICRRRHKPENTKVDFNKMFEVLPVRIITRKRKQPDKYGFEDNKLISTTLKPRYLTKQEDQISADIITENMKRLIKMRKGYTDKDSQNQKSVKEKKKQHSYRKKAVNKSKQRKTLKVKIVNTKRNVKSKNILNSRKSAELKRKNTKENSLYSISPAETTSRRTRSTKNKNHVENSENNRILLKNRNKKPECKPTNKNERAGLTENKVKRSKRQLKAKEKSKNTTVPISILMKKIHEPQSSIIKSPKSLKRSLVDKSNVSNPKRMRSRNTNKNQEVNNKTSRASKKLQLAEDRRVPYVYLVRYQPPQDKMLNSNSNFLKKRTRGQFTRRSVQTNQGVPKEIEDNFKLPLPTRYLP